MHFHLILTIDSIHRFLSAHSGLTFLAPKSRLMLLGGLWKSLVMPQLLSRAPHWLWNKVHISWTRPVALLLAVHGPVLKPLKSVLLFQKQPVLAFPPLSHCLHYFLFPKYFLTISISELTYLLRYISNANTYMDFFHNCFLTANSVISLSLFCISCEYYLLWSLLMFSPPLSI